jgi:anthranilate phosphoribosyltransferase
MSLLPFLHRVSSGAHLKSDEAHCAMSVILEGGASDAALAGFLVALRIKGETAAELAGFARAMRERAIYVDAGEDVIDTCGTGGDGAGTFNISTVAALVMAGAGAKIAKHGNRSISNPGGGSAELFHALGVCFEMTPEQASRAVREIGIGFLFAPALHPAMRFAQPVRRELKMRTVFNLLGPLANPARARRQLIGAPSPEAAALMAEALAELGTDHAFVVHGEDGLDEITTTGATDVYEVRGNAVQKHLWMPEDFRVKRAMLSDLAGGDPERNAKIAREILGGSKGARRDIVLVNAAAGLMVGGIAADLKSGMAKAAEAIDSGAALERLEQLRRNFPAE